MKWFFLVLVLVNAGFLAWHNIQGNGVVTVARVYAPPVSQKILTLDEAPIISSTAIVPPQEDVMEQLQAAIDEQQLQVKIKQSNAQRVDTAGWCPQLTVEREQDRQQLVGLLQTAGWRYLEERMEGERLKYWLYIAAPASREAALEIVGLLKAKKIDSFIINRGEMKNRISLGLYSIKQTADQELQRIAQLSGHKVQVFEHTRVVPLYVLKTVGAVSDAQWETLSAELDVSKMIIRLDKKAC